MNTSNEMTELIEDLTSILVRSDKRHNKYKTIAYHEAGHAFTQIYYGIPPLLVAINPIDGKSGYIIPGFTSYIYRYNDVKYFVDYNEDIDDYLRHTDKCIETDSFMYLNISLYAGTLSEILYSGSFNKTGFKGDCIEIIRRYNEYGIVDFGQLGVGTYIDHTLKILRNNWKNIQLIANDLFVRKTLNQSYFKSAMETLTVNKISSLEGVWDSY